MDFTGKIIRVFDPQSGVSSRTGNSWKKREYLIEIPNGQYPRQVFFSFFGDRADQFPLTGGKEYKISFDIESREFNGRWYTDIRAWKAENPDGTPLSGDGASASGSPLPPPPEFEKTYNPSPMGANDPFGSAPMASNNFEDSQTDDLPF